MKNFSRLSGKNICWSLVCFVFVLGLFGCSSQTGVGRFQQEGKIKVVTTIYPMQDFATQVGGDRVEVVNLVPAGIEPHDFELSTADMQLIEEADVFIYNGAGMEHFVDKTLAAISNKELVVVEAAKDISLLEAKHAHSHEEEGENEEEERENEEEERFDPHTWLSIDNAKLEAEEIKNAFCKIDAENASFYEENFKRYEQELDEVKQCFQEGLADVSSRTIVVAHEAFGYLCNEYGLKQVAVEGLTADSEPDSNRMKEIIDFCKENDIQVIFFEELVSPKVANTIAEEVGATTDLLNPIEGRTALQEQENKTYIDFMNDNLEALKRALK